MKVLQINSVCGYGSTGRIATDLYDIIKADGNDCKIAYGRKDALRIPIQDTYRIGTELDVRLHGMLSRVTDRSGFYSKHATEKFVEYCNAYDPDMIHLHNVHGYYLHLPTLFNYLRHAKKKVVWTLHDCWSFTGHCAHFDFAGCDKWKTGCSHCAQKGTYPASYFRDHSALNYAQKKELFTSLEQLTLVTPSVWLANRVKESFLGKYPVHAIPNGIDLNIFCPTPGELREKYSLGDKTILLGVANVWDSRKGLGDFLYLADALDERYQIILIGVEHSQRLPSNIIGIARTQNLRELAAFYTAADLYINPSVEETMGMTTVEALACGTPALVYDATAVPEAINPSCGFVVPKGHMDGLKKVIEQHHYEKIEAPSCIKRAAEYDHKEMYLRYMNLYKSI